ncbi:MAG TPA: biotin--[acetyl-CoA-carboxylase] ligase [Streptosporangiaceae bacterium]|nr:biotin--[acetyl-CoA-carboxylase] ligase [Streptosporangiaceae bacterium]
MAGNGADAAREPLRSVAVARGELWRNVAVVARTGSTNADLLARAGAGEPEGLVLAAEEQDAGRGRMGRRWVSPPHSALMFSVLLRPAVPPARWGWLPLLTGVAVASAVREVAEVTGVLKWPNDVLRDGRKLAGILAEAADGAVVVGIGLNVSTTAEELPPPRPGALPATSLLLSGASVLDRAALLTAILASLELRYLAWQAAGGNPEPVRAEYTGMCDTLGRQVQVELPSGQVLSGEAVGVDSDGRLVVSRSGDSSEVAVAAGDVVHVR